MKIEDNRALAAKTIDTTNMCSHLQRKLFDAEGEYRAIREEIERDEELTAVVIDKTIGNTREDGIHKSASYQKTDAKILLYFEIYKQKKVICQISELKLAHVIYFL